MQEDSRIQGLVRGLTLLLILIIGVLTLSPRVSVPGGLGSDKLHHLLAFGGLAFTGVLGWPRSWLWVVLVVILYGGAIELIQPHVGRHGEWGDWAADSAGAILGGLAARLLIRVVPLLRGQASRFHRS